MWHALDHYNLSFQKEVSLYILNVDIKRPQESFSIFLLEKELVQLLSQLAKNI